MARKSEFEDIMKVKEKKRLSLNRKKRSMVLYSEAKHSDEEEDSGIHRLESKLAKVLAWCD